MNRVYTCPAGDLPEGETLRLDTPPVVALLSVSGESCVINDHCNHGNAPMSEGYLEDDAAVGCPLHTASFYLKTGRVLCLPVTDPLATYVAYVDSSDVFVGTPEDIR